MSGTLTLRLEVEQVIPIDDYSAICYKVVDFSNGTKHGEVIFRTADRQYAEALVNQVNNCKTSVRDNDELRTRLSHQEAAYQRMKERSKIEVEGLKAIAQCGVVEDCAICPNRKTCTSETVVSIARHTLIKVGMKPSQFMPKPVKVGKGEEVKK